jgi:hypothetical protein
LTRRALALGLLLAGCASGPAAPPPVAAVTDGARIIGYGQGRTPAEARNRAALDVGAQLRVELRSVDRVEERVRVRGGEAATALDAASTLSVTARFDRPEWLEVLSLRPVSGGYDAVAALDRRRAAAGLRASLDAADARLTAALDADPGAADGDDLATLGEAIAADLALLGAVTGRPQTPPASLARLAAWRSARAREAPRRAVGLCLAGGLPEVDARAAVEAALLRQTTRVGACPEAGWRLELTVSLAPRQDPQLPEVWFCDATLDGALRDPAGQTASAVAARGGRATKSAGRTAADACREALAKAATELGESFTLP